MTDTKKLLREEELDNVVGGYAEDCSYVIGELQGTGISTNNVYAAEQLTQLAKLAYGTDKISIRFDGRLLHWGGKSNYYKVNDEVIDQKEFVKTLKAYAEKNDFHFS